MALVIKELIKRIVPYMSQYAFKRTNNCFYKVANDIAFCVEFEKPSNLIYVHYYTIPLYIPHENRCFTYGNRIVIKAVPKTKPLMRVANGCDIDTLQLLEQIKDCLQNTIFPLFKTISTPVKLVDFVSSRGENVFFCNDVDVLRLQFFTYVFVGDWQRYASVKREYERILLNCNHLHHTVKKKYFDEINIIKDIANKNTVLLLNWFNETVHNTLIAVSFKTD